MTNLPGLLVLIIACMNVGTLFYARTATREGEIALRSALGASRARIIGQLFVEALVLASIAAAVGLIAADRALTWGIESAFADKGRRTLLDDPRPEAHDDPLCQWPRGRQRRHVVTAAGAESHAGARATAPGESGHRRRHAAVRPRLDRRDDRASGADGHGHPGRHGEREPVDAQAEHPRANFPAESISPRASMWTGRSTRRPRRRSRSGGRGRSRALERRIAQEPGVVAVTFADRAPGVTFREPGSRRSRPRPAEPAYDDLFRTSAVGPGFFEAFDRPIVAGRGFHEGDRSPAARTVIVNEAFAREFSARCGTRVTDRRSPAVFRVDVRAARRRPRR